MDEKVTVQDQLDELLESKLNMKTAINNNGGEVTDETTFREYPEQIQEVIDKNIVPYSDLADTVELALDINGFLDIKLGNLTYVPLYNPGSGSNSYPSPITNSAIGTTISGSLNTGDIIETDTYTLEIGYVYFGNLTKYYTEADLNKSLKSYRPSFMLQIIIHLKDYIYSPTNPKKFLIYYYDINDNNFSTTGYTYVPPVDGFYGVDVMYLFNTNNTYYKESVLTWTKLEELLEEVKNNIELKFYNVIYGGI